MTIQRTRPIALLIAVVAAGLCTVVSSAAVAPASVQGVVKSASGEPVSGAYVKLSNPETRLTFMVVSQASGRFTASSLPPGKYTAQGIALEFQSQAEPVIATAGKTATIDLSLTARRAPALPHGWPGSPGTVGGGEAQAKLPAPKLPEGEGKQVAETKCVQCHGTWRITSNRGNHAEWEAMVDVMRAEIAASKVKDLTDPEVKRLIDYLAKNFSGEPGSVNPRPDPNSRLPRTLARGAAAKYIAVDFAIPRPNSLPHEIAVDDKGNGWVGERAGYLGKFDPKTFTFSEIAPPRGESPQVRLATVVKGAGSTLWLVDSGPNRRWLEFDTKTSEFDIFPVPRTIKGDPTGNTIRYHPNGTVWLAGARGNEMFGLNPSTKQFVAYAAPSGIKTGKKVVPYGFAISGDGMIWFAENAVNGVGRLDPDTGKIDEFEVPIKNAVPRKVGSDSEGNIWVGLHETGQMLKIDYKDPSNMKLYVPPTANPGTYSICGDLKNGYIWFSEQAADQIGRFDPRTQTWVEFPVPNAESDMRKIEVDPTDPNRIWWSGNASNHLGYIEVLDGK